MKYTIFFLLLILFFGCNTRNDELIVSKTNFALTQSKDSLNKTIDFHNSKKASYKKIAGTYTGLFPCLDCKGIKTTVILEENKSYYLEMDYLGSKKNKVRERGVYEWVDDDNNIYLNNKFKMEFKVGENRIWLVKSLDIKAIKMGKSTNFILQKNENFQ